jgi:type I restriction enzyme S subunit
MSRELPEGWTSRELGEVLSLFRNGFSCKQSASGDTPVSRIETIADGFVNGNRIGFTLWDEKLSKYRVERGDIFFSHINSPAHIGKAAMFSSEEVLYHGMNLMLMRADRGKILPEYLLSILRDDVARTYFRSSCRPAVNQASLSKSIISSFSFLLPPLHEQHRIVEILSSVDKAIAATRAVIEQTRKVKQGVLERLLTKGIGHTRFKQTEIGEIPEGWRIGTLGSIALGLEAGVSVNSESRPKQQGEIGILKTSCVSAGIFDPDEHKTVLLGERDRVKIPVRGDRIIISRMNTPNLVGANGYVENDIGDLFLPDRLWQLSTSENARWLACLLASDQSRQRLSAIATGTSGSMKNISKSKLLDLLLAIPSQAEQREIASIMQEIDASIEADNLTLKGQIATKSALMSDLLTGRKRVTDALPMAAE